MQPMRRTRVQEGLMSASIQPIPRNEMARLKSLRACRVLDTPPEQEFDDLVALAARLCQTRAAIISLVDADRQWFKAKVGVDLEETPRHLAFCPWTMPTDEPLVVENTLEDPRFCDNDLVAGPLAVRFYAGVALRLADETQPGTLCVLDFRPRTLDREQREQLVALARQASSQLELRRKISEQERMAEQRERDAEELRRMRDRAETASAAKSEFLANMSHEIRTPMTAILGYTDLLLEESVDPRVRRDHVGVIRRNGEHLLSIINDVLDLSKLEAKRVEPERIDCSPAQIVGDVVKLLRARAEHQGITLTQEFVNPIPRVIRSDPTRLRQILLNVVGNAVKFTEIGGVRLSVDWEALDERRGRLRFDVADTGVGMSAEQQARLFEPFVQADTSTTRQFGGTGLGLVISRRYALLLGGDLRVESAPGEGSVFTLEIEPETRGAGELVRTPGEWIALTREHASDSAAKKDTTLRGRSVLLVEDGLDNQRLIAHHLRRAGASVETARNGVIGLAAVEAARREGRDLDLILMDMQMPEMDGYQATRAIRSLGLSVPIIALTAHALDGDRERCLRAGCDDYLAKPVDRTRLIERCAALIGQRRAGETEETLDEAAEDARTRVATGTPPTRPAGWKDPAGRRGSRR